MIALAVAPILAGQTLQARANVDSPNALSWRPAPDAIVRQNPPDFVWPWSEGAVPWVLELRQADGPWQRVLSPRNSTSWPHLLKAGAYEWRVSAGTGDALGTIRRFTLAGEARPFVVPLAGEQLKLASQRSRPRYKAWPARSDDSARFISQAYAALRKPSSGEPLYRHPGYEDALEEKRAKRELKQAGQAAAGRIASAALLLQLASTQRPVAEGKRLLLEAASWDPAGASGVGGNHLVARDLVWSMALLYDALHGELAVAERKLVRDRIIERIDEIKREFIDGSRMQRQPFNSHGWVAWGGAAAAATLLAGEDERADALFLEIVPPFVTSISPWGGEEGGFANGTAYGIWDVAAMILPLDVLGQAIGVDLYTKPWLANVGRFIVYFLPPGAPSAPFGDGSEMAPERVGFWTLRALAQRTRDPLVIWAAGQVGSQEKGPLPLALASLSESVRREPLPRATPNSALFSDIGWIAMHSDLADPMRTSVYFKSSPYGSHSHSHADQNALVVHAGGRALLFGSGYYDFYASSHWSQWYATTRAHNAITFDGRRGQATRNIAASGRIVGSRLTADHDIVIGDATPAYSGDLTMAVRTMVYLRPGTILVHDRLASKIPRTWEWNFHSTDRMKGDGRTARIVSGGESLCIDLLEAPTSRFEQSSQFSATPKSKGKTDLFADQWHAAFVADEPSLRAEYVVSMRVGCQGAAPKIERDGDGWSVSVEGPGSSRKVRLLAGRAEVK